MSKFGQYCLKLDICVYNRPLASNIGHLCPKRTRAAFGSFTATVVVVVVMDAFHEVIRWLLKRDDIRYGTH